MFLFYVKIEQTEVVAKGQNKEWVLSENCHENNYLLWMNNMPFLDVTDLLFLLQEIWKNEAKQDEALYYFNLRSPWFPMASFRNFNIQNKWLYKRGRNNEQTSNLKVFNCLYVNFLQYAMQYANKICIFVYETCTLTITIFYKNK